MTDFELITAYSEQIALFFTAITVLTTILFGFLIAVHLVAGRLGLFLLVLASGLYTVVSFGFSGAIFATGARAVSLGGQLVSRINAEGSEISWLFPGIMPPHLPTVFFFLFNIAILLSLLFVVVRRREMRREIQEQ